MEVQRMRNFVNLQPGESRSCVGCHQYRPKAPGGRVPLALRDPPPSGPGRSRARPCPGRSTIPTDVQPILDRHCRACHSGKRRTAGWICPAR